MFKKKNVFFTTLEEMSNILVQATDYFLNNVSTISDTAQFRKQIKEFENASDRHVHNMLIELNKTFITPIEREDILTLTNSLDDVIDGLDACASRIEMYSVVENDPYVGQFAQNIHASALEIQKSIQLLSQKKLLAIREHAIRINELENEADEILHVSIKHLFTNVKDPIDLIKHKEIYERLEKATDYCEDVANTLETIIMRNS